MQISGEDIATQAKADQNSSKGYKADDDWVNIVLEPGMRVWRGVGGRYSPYHIGPNTMGGTMHGQPRQEFWEDAQVIASKSHGYRAAVREYVVMYACPAAHGLCSNNGDYGWGGAEQYFIPEKYQDYLAPTGNELGLS